MIDINLGDNPIILWAYLGVLALTPIMVALVGFFVTRAVKQREHDLNAQQRRREICKDLYDSIGPDVNRIFCYVSDLGDYGRHTPDDIIEAKRNSDRIFFTYGTIWSKATRDAYHAFMEAAFQTHTGVGVPAKIRTSSGQKIAFFKNTDRAWRDEYEVMFTQENNSMAAAKRYQSLVAAFISDMTD